MIVAGNVQLAIEGSYVARGASIARQWLLIQALSARRHGATLAELATELEVSTKTVRRDVSLLQSVGFPIAEQTGDFGRKQWRLDAPGNASDLRFTYDEALSLYLGRRYLEPLAGTLLWEAAQRAYKKVHACLGTDALQNLDKIADTFTETTFGAGDYARHAEAIDQPH